MANGPPTYVESPLNDKSFFGHPRGLQTLFFTEMWERFSYYGMRAILILFMTKPILEGGLGFSEARSGLIYGLYTGTVYVLSLPGGWIADRFLGQRRSVLYGGILIMLGHICLAIPAVAGFYIGLVFVSLGTGLLKPNISTIVGQLYTPEDQRRDSGFAIYYMGINVGATGGQLIVAFLAQSQTFRGWLAAWGIPPHYAWHFGFGAAAVGMAAGLIQYVWGDRGLGAAGKHPVPPKSPQEAQRNVRLLVGILVSLVGLPAVVAILFYVGVPIKDSHIGLGTLLVLVSLGLGIFVVMFTAGEWTESERKRLWVILLLFFGAIFFFAIFEQAGSTLTLMAEKHTNNELPIIGKFPSAYYQNVNPACIVLLSPIFAWLWLRLERRKNQKPSAGPMKKFGAGLILVGTGYMAMIPAAIIAMQGSKAGPGWLISLYFIHTCAELCLSPVGLSWTTRLAPARVAGLAMGIWFTGTAIGNFLAGMSAGLLKGFNLRNVFLVSGAIPIVVGIIYFLLVPWVRKLLLQDPPPPPAGTGH
jgi:proton-dependent oligopeptide transporter, POT family